MAGLSKRQSQQEIRVLKCKNDPMVNDLNKFLIRIANIKTGNA
jgi:hypothetical protein